MRELLMPIDQTGGAWAPIEFALGLARRSGGRVIAGFHPRLETLPVVDAMGGGAHRLIPAPQAQRQAHPSVAVVMDTVRNRNSRVDHYVLVCGARPCPHTSKRMGRRTRA